MKRTTTLLSATFFAAILLGHHASAQTFNKGSLLVSLSEGATYTNYETKNNTGETIKQGNINGQRDPLTVEYGLSRRWGIGINLGGDVFNVNSSSYYNFETPHNTAKVITSELTADVHYHFFEAKRIDVSAFASIGFAGVTITGNSGDGNYQYNAGGGIFRSGLEGRYYIWKRVGVLAMVSGYTSKCSTDGISGNTVANNISTSVSGFAWELGMQYRILK